MKREEMLAKLAAGESPTNVCIDKYRDLYCKIQSGEKLESSDVGINTCALCYKHYALCGDGYALCGDGCSNSCPLFKTGDGCLDKEDSSYRILAHLLSDYEYNDVAWDKEKILTAIEGMIASLKKAQKYETEKADKDTYIEGEKECGLKVGDTVKVTREAEFGEQGWSNSWTHNMKVGYVGKIVEIASDDDSACGIDIEVEEQSSSYGYPYFVLEKVEKTYHVGQHFSYGNEEEYLLARVERRKINLFNLSSGGKWSTTIAVSNEQKITEDEMKKLADKFGYWKEFELIE